MSIFSHRQHLTFDNSTVHQISCEFFFYIQGVKLNTGALHALLNTANDFCYESNVHFTFSYFSIIQSIGLRVTLVLRTAHYGGHKTEDASRMVGNFDKKKISDILVGRTKR